MPQLKHFAQQHYEAIAQTMQSAHKHNWLAICEKLADMLKADNSAFRREKFLKACLPGNNVRRTFGDLIGDCDEPLQRPDR